MTVHVTQLELDAIADIIWWLKGYTEEKDDDECAIEYEHINILQKIKGELQLQLNERII